LTADHQLIVSTVLAGGTIDEAATRIDRPVATVRRWLRDGRKNPDGQWGQLARQVDTARVARSRLPEEAGARVAEVEAFIATLGDVQADLIPRLGLLRTVARKLDWAESTNTGIAAMATERLAARYADLLDDIQPVVSPELAALQEALSTPLDDDATRYRDALSLIASSRSDGSKDYKAPRFTAEEMQQIANDALHG
jgi:hypothetical protein